MKKFILSLIALAVVSISAHGQGAIGLPSYGPTTVINDVVVLAQAATNLYSAATFYCGKQQNVGVSISTSNTVDQSTSGAINGAMFVRSVDGVNYETNGTFVTWVPVGKNWLTTFTNVAANGAGYIKVAYVTNAAASGGNTTNVGSLHIVMGTKISAP